MVPPSLANLSNLLYLDLTAYSDVYEQFDRTSSLKPTSMDLWVSDLSWLSNLNSLQYLGLGGVRLNKGSVPSWPTVTNLFLGNNKFSGPIPLNIGQEMPSMSYLDLSRNYLNGSIPSSIRRMKNLCNLDLSHNNLSGNISGKWSGQLLWLIDLSNNSLSGSIPNSWCSQLPSLQWLRLSRANLFTGNLPEQLCQLAELRVLDLSHNNLSGSVPKCLGNLEAIKSSDELILVFTRKTTCLRRSIEVERS
ncbi:hypothetical protein M0R45_028594 [Rubus argutus]|uniref:Uncharacterized protein n=1 Tax=Rubus argutus TaxID=59490 RepID=A0AAW1W7S6_RUBAR